MILVNKIKDNVFNFRVINYKELDFHGPIFRNDSGSSYNAYLILDDEITLIDTVGEEYSQVFLGELKTILGGKSIDNIIINHVEPDHSSAFLEVFKHYNNAKCYCSERGEKPLRNMFFSDVNYTTVKNNDEISTGNYTFLFKTTPFVHWPDNMVTYLKEEKMLFSNDCFGNLITGSSLYDSEYELALLIQASKDYYANIMMPCGKFVLKALEEIKMLDIDLICPSHGIVWKENVKIIMEKYRSWGSYEYIKNKVVIIYDSIWGNSEIITDDLAVKLIGLGFDVTVYKAGTHNHSKIMSDVLDARVVLVGTANFNGTMLPTIAEVLERLYALKPKNKIGGVFGAYGWSKAHIERVRNRLCDSGIDVVDVDISSNYTPDISTIKMTDELAFKIKECVEL